MICPICGSHETKKRGFSFINTGKKQRYYCYGHEGSFSEGDEVEDSFPAVLVMDIETLPLVAYSWDTRDVYISMAQLIKDWCICGWAAKWLGDDKMVSEYLTPKQAIDRDDKQIVEKMWTLFDQADVVIAQNGKKFDFKKLNTRWWAHGLTPPSSYKAIDTLEAARSVFGMTFNSLDYLAKYMHVGGKLKTDFELWKECDAGDQKALNKMRTYNENDVLILERVYMKMRAWIPNHPDFRAYEKVQGVCPRCFSPIEYIGLYTAAKRQYKEFRCTNCGGIGHDTKWVK